ncbi:MAG: hypothetical protein Q9212_006635 [Teloschistes hypoglaucus]
MEHGQGSSLPPTTPPNEGNSQASAQASLEWHVEIYNWKNGTTVRAIRHEHIRAELLDAALSTGLEWTHPQPEGEGQLDVTAPWPEPRDQRDWGFDDRAHYPSIIFQLNKLAGQDPLYEVTTWYHEGLLVLDMYGRPMRKLPHLPDVISAKIHAGHIEALMRTHSATQYQDIHGRMPSFVWNKKGVRVPVRSKGALSKAAAGFRETAGCLNWTNRRGKDRLNQYILENLPPQLRAMNTTRGWRNLTKAESVILRNCEIGSRPENTRHDPDSAEGKERQHRYFEKSTDTAAEAYKKRPRADRDMGDYIYEDEERHLDYRNAIPDAREPREHEALSQALRPTIEHLQAIVGENFQPAPYWFLPYSQQLRSLQIQLDDRYQELNGPAARAPKLVQLTRWGGCILNWRTARFWDDNSGSLYRTGEDGNIGQRIMEDDPEYAQHSYDLANRADREESDEDEIVTITDDEPGHSPPTPGAYLIDSEGNPVPRTATFRGSASPPPPFAEDSSEDDDIVDRPVFARSPTTLSLSQYGLDEPSAAGASANGGEEEAMREDESVTRRALDILATQREQGPQDPFMGDESDGGAVHFALI